MNLLHHGKWKIQSLFFLQARLKRGITSNSLASHVSCRLHVFNVFESLHSTAARNTWENTPPDFTKGQNLSLVNPTWTSNSEDVNLSWKSDRCEPIPIYKTLQGCAVNWNLKWSKNLKAIRAMTDSHSWSHVAVCSQHMDRYKLGRCSMGARA